jgi:ferredoxin
VAFGPRIVIEAVGDGRRAALAIDTHLTGRRGVDDAIVVRVFETFGYDHPFAIGDYEKVPRGHTPTLPVDRRSATALVELPLSEQQAREEGSRCLHCWVNTVFDSSRMDGSECIQCGGCADVCPENCIDLVALARIASTPGATKGARLPDGTPLEILETGVGAALVKDETACIRCGLCARKCPAGVITMQAFSLASEARLVALADRIL